jgi:O-antigen/teichoic acid export membrane protein
MFLLVAGRSLGFAASFVIPLVLARLFGAQEFGTYKQLFLIHGVLFGIAQLGMAESLFYFIPSGPREGARYAANAMAVLAGAGVACWLSLTLLRAPISHWMNNPLLEGLLPLIGFYLLLTLTAVVLENVMIARHRCGHAAFSYGISELLKTILYLLPALLFRDLRWLLAGAAVFGCVRVGAALLYLRGRGSEHRFTGDVGLLRRQLAYALPFQLAVFVEMIALRLDQFAVSIWFDPATFAVYSIGILQVPLIDLISNSASTVMMVRMVGQATEGDSGEALKLWHKTTRSLALVFFPVTGVLVITARPLITALFTDRYAASVPIFAIWSLTVLFAAFQTDGVLRAHAAMRALVGVNLARLAVAAGLTLLGVKFLGLQGIVAAAVAGAAVSKALGIELIRRRLDVPFARALPWRALGSLGLAAVAAAALAFPLATLDGTPAAVRLVLAGAAYGAIYLALVVVADLLEPEEKLAFARVLQKFGTPALRGGFLWKGVR